MDMLIYEYLQFRKCINKGTCLLGSENQGEDVTDMKFLIEFSFSFLSLIIIKLAFLGLVI